MKTTDTAPADSRSNFRPVLYTKIGCPWCAEAREVLAPTGSLTTNAA